MTLTKQTQQNLKAYAFCLVATALSWLFFPFSPLLIPIIFCLSILYVGTDTVKTKPATYYSQVADYMALTYAFALPITVIYIAVHLSSTLSGILFSAVESLPNYSFFPGYYDSLIAEHTRHTGSRDEAIATLAFMIIGYSLPSLSAIFWMNPFRRMFRFRAKANTHQNEVQPQDPEKGLWIALIVISIFFGFVTIIHTNECIYNADPPFSKFQNFCKTYSSASFFYIFSVCIWAYLLLGLCFILQGIIKMRRLSRKERQRQMSNLQT